MISILSNFRFITTCLYFYGIEMYEIYQKNCYNSQTVMVLEWLDYIVHIKLRYKLYS